MIIYRIINNKSGKSYIGQSVNDFNNNDKSINMSKLIENYMKEFIDKYNKNI